MSSNKPDYGWFKLDDNNQALDKSGAALVGEPIIDPKYPGLKTYNYQAPGVGRTGKPDGSYKPVQQKTVYGPNIISDQKMVSMQMQAVKKGAELLLKYQQMKGW